MLKFFPEKTEITHVTHGNNEKVVQQYNFFCHDRTDYHHVSEEKAELMEKDNTPKSWTLSGTVASDLLRWMKTGRTVLSVTRKGSELKTRYEIMPKLDD